MKLTFKDLKQQRFVIDAEPSETIADVKAKIEKEKGWEAGVQKLIYSGKILQDANTVESYNIQEKGFIVCMVNKVRAAPAASSSSSAAPPSTPAKQDPAQTPAAPAAPSQSTSSAALNVPATPSPAPGAAAPQERSFTDSSMALSSNDRQAAVDNMLSMGFPRDQIDAAMQAAFYNPDRAVEYLLNGIPENLRRERPSGGAPSAGAAAAAAPVAPAATEPAMSPPPATGDEPVNLFEAAAQAGQGTRGGGGGAAAAAGGAAAGAAGSLDFLRNNPQFQQLRQIVQQQPQMLEPILQQVGAGNPQLATMISDQPEAFLRLLAEDAGDDDAALPPGAQAIQVTEEEREAIERLCRLGFERDLVIQAYFACDKNEELAANFLFDQPEDDDIGQ